MTNSLEPSASFGSSDAVAQVDLALALRGRVGRRGRRRRRTAAAVSGFPSQSDAESWIGEVWRDLLEDGVDQVTPLRGRP